MIQDAQGELSNQQAITATAKSTNTIDLGPNSYAKNAHGVANPELVFTVTETFTAAGAGTLEIQLRDSNSSDMSSPRVLDRSPVFALADLVAGQPLPWTPTIQRNSRRYIDANYVVSTGPMTAGKITARTTAGRQTNV